jgi:hypothetical protein
MILNARHLPLIALLGVTAGCATSPVVLRPTGAGAVAFGGALAEAELMVGEKASGQRQDAGCGYVEFRSLPGLRFTVENGVVTRADAGPGVRNSLGVQIGDTTDSVVSLYPDVAIRRSRASLGGTELFLVDPDGRYAIVMEAAGNKIIAIRAGLSTSVGSPQGCP